MPPRIKSQRFGESPLIFERPAVDMEFNLLHSDKRSTASIVAKEVAVALGFCCFSNMFFRFLQVPPIPKRRFVFL